MKNKKILRSFGDIDEQYIDEARPEAEKSATKKVKKPSQTGQRRKWLVPSFASAVAAVLILAFVIMLLPRSNDEISLPDGNYKALASFLKATGDDLLYYDNNSSGIIIGGADGGFEPGGAIVKPDEWESSKDGNDNGEYVEVTDNQEKAITEADLIKRTDKYAFYLSRTDRTLYIYSLDGYGDDSTEGIKEKSPVASLAFDLESVCFFDAKTEKTEDISPSEMFLSMDARTLTVFLNTSTTGVNGAKNLFRNYTVIVRVDVSKPDSPVIKDTVKLSGAYNTSRLTSGCLIIDTYASIYSFDCVSYNEPETFVPYYETKDGKTYVEERNILLPEYAKYATYKNLFLCDAETLEVKDHATVVGAYSDIYVSENYIYTTISKQVHVEKEIDKNVKEFDQRMMSEISIIKYGESALDVKGSVKVEGTLKDRKSLDEKDGILRLVTTTARYYGTIVTRDPDAPVTTYVYTGDTTAPVVWVTEPVIPDDTVVANTGVLSDGTIPVEAEGTEEPEIAGELSSSSKSLSVANIASTTRKAYEYPIIVRYTSASEVSASLFCIDLETLKIVSSVEGFAPNGERVQSVRFENDSDYLYVCTAVVFTDPVFFFDLSDINNITYKETDPIDGYSHSLMPIGNGYLVGFGYESFNDAKIEVYKESDDKIISVAKLVLEGTYIPTEYKALYVNSEKAIIGFGADSYGYYEKEEWYRYMVLSFENEELTVLVDTPIDGIIESKRGFVADEYYYMFSGGKCLVTRIDK